MLKLFPLLMFSFITLLIAGCADDNDPKEPQSHEQPTWDYSLHATEATNDIISCKSCHFDTQKDCARECHNRKVTTITPPTTHKPIVDWQSNHKKLSISMDKKDPNTSCYICHNMNNLLPSNPLCHANKQKSLETWGVGPAIFE